MTTSRTCCSLCCYSSSSYISKRSIWQMSLCHSLLCLCKVYIFLCHSRVPANQLIASSPFSLPLVPALLLFSSFSSLHCLARVCSPRLKLQDWHSSSSQVPVSSSRCQLLPLCLMIKEALPFQPLPLGACQQLGSVLTFSSLNFLFKGEVNRLRILSEIEVPGEIRGSDT